MTSGYSSVGFRSPMGSSGSTRVGYDVGTYNDTNFYSVSASVLSNALIPNDGRKYVENQLSMGTLGYNVASLFKNLVFRDITDTDLDGVIDFEDNCPFVYNPNQNDVNNNGIGDICDQSLDVSERSLKSVKLWPNPSSSGWNIASDVTLNDVKVISVDGQKFYHVQPNLVEFFIDNSTFPKGVFIIIVNDNHMLKALK